MTSRIPIIAAILTLVLPSIMRAAENAPGITATEIKIGATYSFSGAALACAATGIGPDCLAGSKRLLMDRSSERAKVCQPRKYLLCFNVPFVR
jgi:hypothetical protein